MCFLVLMNYPVRCHIISHLSSYLVVHLFIPLSYGLHFVFPLEACDKPLGSQKVYPGLNDTNPMQLPLLLKANLRMKLIKLDYQVLPWTSVLYYKILIHAFHLASVIFEYTHNLLVGYLNFLLGCCQKLTVFFKRLKANGFGTEVNDVMSAAHY